MLNNNMPAVPPLIPGEGGTGGINFAPSSEYIGMAVQEYYNWVNNSAFYNSSSPYLKPFYTKVQNWERWINGVVPGFHDFDKGVIPTHLAKAIVDKISALVYGGGIMFQVTNKSDVKDVSNETLEHVSKWAQKVGLRTIVQNVIRFSAGLGTGAFKLNADGEKQLWVEAVPMSRARYAKDAKGDIVGARFIVRIFERDDKQGEVYGLYEERYYENDASGKRASYCIYKMYKVYTTANQGQAMNEVYTSWEELPKWVRAQLKENYYAIRLDKPIRMPFVDLGIYAYQWTPCVSSMPHLTYGDSVLEGLQKYLCEYDILSACIDTEMYVSRARVMAKKPIQNPKKANYNSGLDNFLLTYYEEMGTDSKPLTFIQPDIRAEQFKSLRNMTLENISTAIGIAPSSFASYLQDNSNRTAREVSAEESSTTLTVENKREGLLGCLNKLVETVCKYYGKTEIVKVEFSKAGQTNYTLLVENAVKIYQAGGSSLEQFVRTVNPNMDEQQIAEEIRRIKAEEKERNARRENSMWGNMDTGSDLVI